MNALDKKSLGQFFSGGRLGSLLVSMIPDEAPFSSVIDPMAGEGDLLRAATNRAGENTTFVGIEIDPDVAAICKKQVPAASVVVEDAFRSPAVVRKEGFDIVVANPPYVRYQLQKGRFSSVRSALKQQLESLEHLTAKEKLFFLKLADSYAGTADTAVPSWILCAALLSHNGWLAIVVPEAWLSRDYAMPVQYMLLKLFDIHHVVRDISATWFADALVRTCLVVAQRKPMKNIRQMLASKTRRIDLGADTGDADSLVGNLRVGGLRGRKAWNRVFRSRKTIQTDHLSAITIGSSELFPGLAHIGAEPFVDDADRAHFSRASALPFAVKSMLPAMGLPSFQELDRFGIKCGQGLRTGANEFFYLKKSEKEPESFLSGWNGASYKLAPSVCLAALQKQTDISSLVVRPENLTRVLFYCGDKIRPDDVKRILPTKSKDIGIVDNETARYISDAEVGFLKHGKRIFDLSAVQPNIRRVDDRYLSFWYQLPRLAPRHTPDLCIPRVNGDVVSCSFVDQKSTTIVDANFSTLWGCDDTILSFFCILNSIWFKYYAEVQGTIMGGGALKLEASSIRKMLFPCLTKTRLRSLESIARSVIATGLITKETQWEIDKIVLSPFGKRWKRVRDALYEGLANMLKNRGTIHD